MLPEEIDAVHEVPVIVDNALGRPGGAGGVDEQRHFVSLWPLPLCRGHIEGSAGGVVAA
eukprot:CAMPEP_0171123390 /NCGR_PEP_ID=MMETSP0766_2-20121228/107032_1 /TAXON_ID=439317 /ORGANISM="Gambierdiscus australes, Strain CAWD 149" /LENGTH=58 /DNA_ID=CAMNT_0011586259 /DNA_START=15 /DNA_END=191 /DNA_ORIENTATION=-